MNFSQRTYLVLEFSSSDWTNQIHCFREKYEPFRRKLPVEITVIGSSGVGVFLPEQDAKAAIETIDRFAKRMKPIAISFKGKGNFPDSHLYFFEPTNDLQLKQLQNEIVKTGLKFGTSPYPYTPHCTIADLGDSPSQEALAELELIHVPTKDIIVDAVSFYQLTTDSCQLLHRSVFG